MIRIMLIIQEALKSVLSSKMRTLLSVLSIALGIAGVTVVVATVQGANSKAYELVDTFGADALFVTPGNQKSHAAGNRSNTLTFDDVDALRDQFPNAYIVIPMRARTRDISFQGVSKSSIVIGSTAGYGRAWNWPVVEGNDFLPDDVARAANKCIIGTAVKDELFGDIDPIGKTMEVGKTTCEVTGVLADRTLTSFGMNLNDRVIMPITTFMKKVHRESKYVNVIRMRFEDKENLEIHTEGVRQFLRARHAIPEGEDDDFSVLSAGNIMKFFVAVSGALVVFLGIVTLLSVIVGGFVMANLFLLSVQERVKEIGVRRAFGARRSDIFMQFIFEFMIITLLGSILGFLVGAGAAKLLSSLDIFQVIISPAVFFLCVGASFIIALVFGVAPARRASNIDPIVALRSM